MFALKHSLFGDMMFLSKSDFAIEILNFNTTDVTLANHIEKYIKDYSRKNSNINQLSEHINICLKRL